MGRKRRGLSGIIRSGRIPVAEGDKDNSLGWRLCGTPGKTHNGLRSLKGSHTGNAMFDAFSDGNYSLSYLGVSLAKPRFTPGYYLRSLQRQDLHPE